MIKKNKHIYFTPPDFKSKGRIEYIDALRGFTMTLVVMFHVFVFTYRGWEHVGFSSYNIFFARFRMPLFFFISGFIYYNYNKRCDIMTGWQFIKKKAQVQLVPTAVFLLLYIYNFSQLNISSLTSYITDFDKEGYWFTVELFFFFVLITLIRMTAQKLFLTEAMECILFTIIIAAFILVYYIMPNSFWLNSKLKSALQMNYHIYMIYFLFGCLYKSRFKQICRFMDSPGISAAIISAFTITGMLFMNGCQFPLSNYILSFGGIIIVFSFFRRYQNAFTHETFIGRVSQYIGRRTLDIYLLHYFFLPRNLQLFGKWFAENNNPTIELFVTLLIALIVISLCIISSNILRISPWLGQYLFGVKQQQTPTS